MKLLKTITDADFPEEVAKSTGSGGLPNRPNLNRSASRAIVFDKDGKIALLHVSNHDYYKLPGGGIEEGEDIIQALKRECIEEIGCEIAVGQEVGEIHEVRMGKYRLEQSSYCYIADLVGEKGTPKFEQGEIDNGFKEIWVGLDEAIDMMRNCKPKNSYSGKFIVMRDLLLLETARSMRQR